MAGSNPRTRIQGHRVSGDEAALKTLAHQPAQTLSHLFREALEHGRTRVVLHDRPFILVRQPDHTFLLTAEEEGHLVF